MNGATKIVFADPHKCVLMGMQTLLLASGQNLEVAGFAQNEKELLHLAEAHNPQIIVSEIQLPVLDGIVGLRKFIEKFPHILIIAHTAHDEIFIIYQLANSGIKGCVSKNSLPDELPLAIQSVNEGDNYYCPVTEEKLNEFNKYGFILSPNEMDLLPYFCEGKTSGEIAQIMCKSTRTIEHNCDTLKEKFHVKTKGELMKAAIKKGYHLVRVFIGLVIHTFFSDENLLTLFA